MSRKCVILKQETYDDLLHQIKCRRQQGETQGTALAQATNQQAADSQNDTSAMDTDPETAPKIAMQDDTQVQMETEKAEEMETDAPEIAEAAVDNVPRRTRSRTASGNHRWLAELPPSFRKEASRVLKLLQESTRVRISKSGTVSVDGTELSNTDIIRILRALVVPFHKGTIPKKIERVLKGQWTKTRAVWKPLYNESTLGRPKGRKGAQRH